jgi:tRNA(Ile)-lysidine synthase
MDPLLPVEDEALSEAAFARLMAAVGPFEENPLLAVGVSGGRDSLALAWLAHRWAMQHGGKAVALTVDHRLRPEAADEAAQVAQWVTAWGMEHHCLVNREALSGGDIQASARRVRYHLLEDWCAGVGCLHLLLGHHQQDQAETVMLRLGRGSGVQGLSAMAAVSYRRSVRLVRPLLDQPRGRLEALLHRLGQSWIDDPSNDQSSYARVRVRQLLPDWGGLGFHGARLAATAQRLAEASAVCEGQAVALLAKALYPHPAGWCLLDPRPFARVARETALRALGGILAAYGGQSFGPRADRLCRLYEQIIADEDDADAPLAKGVTVHGCRIRLGAWGRVVADRTGRGAPLLIAREQRHLERQMLPSDGQEILWDNRFRAFFNVKDEEHFLSQWSIGPIAENASSLTSVIEQTGSKGEKTILKNAWKAIPGIARASMPALYQGDELVAVPHLGWAINQPANTLLGRLDLRFSPQRAMALVGFSLAADRSGII